jgi:hypothetical protein
MVLPFKLSFASKGVNGFKVFMKHARPILCSVFLQFPKLEVNRKGKFTREQLRSKTVTAPAGGLGLGVAKHKLRSSELFGVIKDCANKIRCAYRVDKN